MITYPQAALGAGNNCFQCLKTNNCKIHPGTQVGETITLRGKACHISGDMAEAT